MLSMKDWSVETPCIHAEDDLCLALKWPYKTDFVWVPGRFFSDCGAVHTKAPDEVLVGRLLSTRCHRLATALPTTKRLAWVGACRSLGEDVEIVVLFGCLPSLRLLPGIALRCLQQIPPYVHNPRASTRKLHRTCDT